ncbi:uncharacterized protein LOC114311285 [Camellia sinensis]|uniref:uncharacterized protein LOC114311285 n=1 Tax=Camellia sinensis TaxID=4442 RepID=UPI00103581D2|nr:uncharacterized protein LOC114311285 [Camellia sinensis]
MWFANLSRFAPELVETEDLRCFKFESKLHDDIRVRIAGSWHKRYSVLIEAAAHVEAAVLAMGQDREEPMVMDSGKGERKVVTCFKCGQLGHKSPACLQRKRAGLLVRPVAAPPESSSQPGIGPIERIVGKQSLGPSSAQILNQSRAQAPPTCWTCNQPGHIRRFCTQPGLL